MTTRILFVCLGNICRSPTAEGVAKTHQSHRNFQFESAGTGAWHVGEAPDRRAQGEAALRGYDLSDQRARQISADDFHAFDHIVAMDTANLEALTAMRPTNARAEISRLLDHAPDKAVIGPDGTRRTDVPDPYYEGAFDLTLDLIEVGVDGLLSRIGR
ncbi:MAG: low molecular weight protein-tyrosine-phosphatase [Pikeienuella sp.]